MLDEDSVDEKMTVSLVETGDRDLSAARDQQPQQLKHRDEETQFSILYSDDVRELSVSYSACV